MQKGTVCLFQFRQISLNIVRASKIMATWFEQNAVDLIGHALTVIGIVGAAVTVVWQLGCQHKSSLLLQRDNAREELKLRLHEIITQKVRMLSSANVQAAMYAHMIPLNVENYQRQLAQGLQPPPVKERAPDFHGYIQRQTTH
jgi:hypothetical protein